MKKLIALVLVAILAVFAAFAGTGEEAAPETIEETLADAMEETVYSIGGIITEITEEGLLVNAGESGMVLVKTDEETVLDVSGEIAAGDYITVVYGGMMSRSIPAQITADVIRMYVITGKIIAADPENNGVLLETETHGEIYAHLPEPWLENTAETLKIYFEGMMTMSIPPQISANHVISLG